MFDPGTAAYMTSLLEGGIQYIRHHTLQWPEEQVQHRHDHQDHLAFLEEPFHEAIEAIHRRMHEHGILH
jgi:hypothetical protein